jgi:hypothetical protein
MAISAAASALTSFTQSVAAAPAGSPAASKPKPSSEAATKTVTAWEDKNRLEKLQAQFRDKVMRQRNLTDDVMASMTATGRAGVEASIKREAAQQMQQSMVDQAISDLGKDGPAAPQVLDVKV